MRLLLVEDDAMVGESVREGLLQDGFAVDWVRDGHSAELAIANGIYDLLLLDLGLPKRTGIEVLNTLRRNGDPIPVMILTARDAVADRIKGLDSGADDYVIKPFDLEEIAARIRALWRRRSGRTSVAMKVGRVSLDPATREVECDGKSVSLSPREFTLLEALLDRPGVVLSRERLEEKLYGWGEEVESNTVEVYIHSLRRKLGQGFIKNIRGVGYLVPR